MAKPHFIKPKGPIRSTTGSSREAKKQRAVVRANTGKMGNICLRISKSPTRVGPTPINSSLNKPIHISTIGPSEDRPREAKVNHVTKTHAITISCSSST